MKPNTLAFGRLLCACGASDYTLKDCVASNDEFYGVEAGCDDLLICLEQGVAERGDGTLASRGKPISPLEWGDTVEDCDKMWCDGQVEGVAADVCP